MARPLDLFFGLKGPERDDEIARLLDDAQISPALARGYLSELSGGQKQCVAVACALAAQLDLLLCDEVISALDVSIQVRVLELLARIRAEKNMAMVVFVTHDLAVVRGADCGAVPWRDDRGFCPHSANCAAGIAILYSRPAAGRATRQDMMGFTNLPHLFPI